MRQIKSFLDTDWNWKDKNSRERGKETALGEEEMSWAISRGGKAQRASGLKVFKWDKG